MNAITYTLQVFNKNQLIMKIATDATSEISTTMEEFKVNGLTYNLVAQVDSAIVFNESRQKISELDSMFTLSELAVENFVEYGQTNMKINEA